MHAQTPGHQFPVNPCPHGQTDGNPAFRDPGDEDSARQPHQQPAAHIRCARRERGDDRPQATPTQNIVVKVFGRTPCKEPYQDHAKNIDKKCHQHRCANCHLNTPQKCSTAFPAVFIPPPERGGDDVCLCWPRVSCRMRCSDTNDLTLHLHQFHPRFHSRLLEVALAHVFRGCTCKKC